MFHPFDLIFWSIRFRFWRAGLRSTTMTIRGEQLEFWQGGKGEPVLLIHGLGGSTLQDFRRVASRLVGRHRVLGFDLPGFGLSCHIPFQQSVANQVEFIRHFLDQIHVNRVHLFGNSMGGWIALKFARQYPNRVHKLVLAASAGIRFKPPPLDIFTPHNESGMRRLLSYLFYRPPALPGWFLRDWLRISMERRQAIVQMLASMVAEQDVLDDCIHEIQIPTLILWGAHDRLIPLETGQRLASLMPNARLEVLDTCGHLLLHEDFPGIAKHLDTFFIATESEKPKNT